MTASRTIRHLDLFSGIGGFAQAVRWAGGQTVGFCEIDPWCRALIARQFPGVPIHDNVKTLGGNDLLELGPIDLVTGGYPCQPFSLAGQRRGEHDERHLWPEMRRIVDEVRPAHILAENVFGHITMGLDVVLANLEADGYAARATVIPAAAVSALHRRDRVWIMAWDVDPARPRGFLVDPGGSGPSGPGRDIEQAGLSSLYGDDIPFALIDPFELAFAGDVANTDGSDGKARGSDGLGEREPAGTPACAGSDTPDAGDMADTDR